MNKTKKPGDSKAEMMVRMFPSESNPAGNIFGGEILKQIDTVAGIVAQRHCESNAVTASIDRVNFLKPVYVGNVLDLHARINYVHRSSMEIEITVDAEDLRTGETVRTGTAFVTMVALNDDGKPTQVPELILQDDDDKKRFQEGKIRMQQRIDERKKPN